MVSIRHGLLLHLQEEKKIVFQEILNGWEPYFVFSYLYSFATDLKMKTQKDIDRSSCTQFFSCQTLLALQQDNEGKERLWVEYMHAMLSNNICVISVQPLLLKNYVLVDSFIYLYNEFQSCSLTPFLSFIVLSLS